MKYEDLVRVRNETIDLCIKVAEAWSFDHALDRLRALKIEPARTAREVLGLRKQLELLPQPELDKLVRECMAAQAEAIITEGREAQLAWLMLESL